MANLAKRDKKKRKIFQSFEQKRLALKSLIRDVNISKQIRFQCIFELTKFPRNSSIVRIKNRCIHTGRGKGILTSFRLSRISFRELACQGLLPGVLKASW